MEIAQLKADKERLERELKALEGESPYVPTDKNGLQSLHDLIDQERRKFKNRIQPGSSEKEHKRLQIMAAGRSPAAQRKPAGF